MRKNMRCIGQNQTKFIKKLKSLCGTNSLWKVWSDFITLTALAIANGVDRSNPMYDAREKEYLATIGKYLPEEQQIFPELFAFLVLCMEEDPEQDFLGETFMELNLNNRWKGQHFTPYCVSQAMIKMVMADLQQTIQQQGWVSIQDPCCGSGALLIAARNEIVQRGLGPHQTLYVAQDIDRTAALMCYIQLSLLGCAGYVTVDNSLTDPATSISGSSLLFAPSEGQEVWLMPALFSRIWTDRIRLEKLKPLMM